MPHTLPTHKRLLKSFREKGGEICTIYDPTRVDSVLHTAILVLVNEQVIWGNIVLACGIVVWTFETAYTRLRVLVSKIVYRVCVYKTRQEI
jgi:hypothetical protein